MDLSISQSLSPVHMLINKLLCTLFNVCYYDAVIWTYNDVYSMSTIADVSTLVNRVYTSILHVYACHPWMILYHLWNVFPFACPHPPYPCSFPSFCHSSSSSLSFFSVTSSSLLIGTPYNITFSSSFFLASGLID